MLWVVRKIARDNLARLMALHNCSLTPGRESYQSVCVRERERVRVRESVRAQRLNHFAIKAFYALRNNNWIKLLAKCKMLL